MVRDDLACAREPEGGQPRENAALVRDRRRQDDVERGDAVARDQCEGAVVQRVDLAHLPARDMGCSLGDHAPTSSWTRRPGTRAKTASTCLVYARTSNTSSRGTRDAICVSERTSPRKSSPSSHARIAWRCTARYASSRSSPDSTSASSNRWLKNSPPVAS